VNFDGVKNMIGTFAPPYAVLNDVLFLTTLDQRDWIGGVSEAFKVAVLKDAAFFQELESSAEALAARDLDAMARVVQRCAVLHLEHIRQSGDPFEFGSARPLDFGHWSAHKLETLSNYELRHGEAVAIGIALDLFIAARMNLISLEDCERVCSAMERCGLLLWHPSLVRKSPATGTLAVVAGLEEFRQHLGGRLTVTLPEGLGRKREVHAIAPELVEAGVAWLTARHSARQKAARKV
jgi:3-dehydroquinate synthase